MKLEEKIKNLYNKIDTSEKELLKEILNEISYGLDKVINTMEQNDR